MYREGANNAVKNVQDGTLHMKEQNTIVNLSSSQDLSQCLFIKWTISGKPPVGLKSPQGSKWGHSNVIHYVAH